jgi:hypothetical protein
VNTVTLRYLLAYHSVFVKKGQNREFYLTDHNYFYATDEKREAKKQHKMKKSKKENFIDFILGTRFFSIF